MLAGFISNFAVDAMPLPKGIARDTVELQTADMPYGITINYIMTDSANVEINGTISDNAFLTRCRWLTFSSRVYPRIALQALWN